MATKRKSLFDVPERQNTNKKHRLHEESKEEDYDDQHFIGPLPSLAICQILRRLPMKSAIRTSLVSKQWKRELWPWGLPLDIDQQDFIRDGILDVDQHQKFINLFETCLKNREQDELLDKFKFRMTPVCEEDNARLDKWLSFALERNVRELDISLGTEPTRHYFPQAVFVAKSITSLNLESLVINNRFVISLPSLKTMSLKSVHFGEGALSRLIAGCPALEDLSLTQPSFKYTKRCERITINASKLKSFTWDSTQHDSCSQIRLTLYRCRKLKHVNVSSCYDLIEFELHGCQDGLKAKVDVQYAETLTFNGKLKCDVSIKAPKLQKASIGIRDRKPALTDEWKHFSELRDLLSEIAGCANELELYIHDVEAFISPKNFVKTCSPLPKLSSFCVYILHSSTGAKLSELNDSLSWMGPKLTIVLK